MNGTWTWGVTPALKNLSDSKLRDIFNLPPFRIVLPDKPHYAFLASALKKEGYKVEQIVERKCRTVFALFLCDLTLIYNREHWVYYSALNGGSALSLGPTFTTLPSLAAKDTGFWLPLEQWCRLPKFYDAFQKDFTITIVLDKDHVPEKVKRIWIKKFLADLSSYKKPLIKSEYQADDPKVRKQMEKRALVKKDGKAKKGNKQRKAR